MILIDILAGVIFGMLAGMGIGGAGLIVIYLTLLRGYSQIDAQAANLIFFAVAAAASMFIHAKKRKIRYIPVLITAAAGITGAYFGSHTASVIPQEITRKIFGVMLVASGLITMAKTMSKKSKIHD